MRKPPYKHPSKRPNKHRNKRIVSLWFPKLPSDRVLRARKTEQSVDGPFALTIHQKNANRLYCLNQQAEHHGLHQGMSYSDARAFCPDLQSLPADPYMDERFLRMLARWATRYCPWVGLEEGDKDQGPNNTGLVLNITGSEHLFGGEEALLEDLRFKLERTGLQVRIGLADTRGGAWALAHFGAKYTNNIAPPKETRATIQSLPVVALRLDEKTCVSLQRLGVRTIADLIALPRPTLTRRFGLNTLIKLDQALGHQQEEISPLPNAAHYGVRITLPEPIGLSADVMAGTKLLLGRLCHKLKTQEMGARVLRLTMRRTDQESQHVTLRLARPLHDDKRILPLFEAEVDKVDAGYGIDQLRLEAIQVQPLHAQQVDHLNAGHKDKLYDLITRIGNRIGLENVHRFLPADSHIPERSFVVRPAAYSDPSDEWTTARPRPVRMFYPEPIGGETSNPPDEFHWRRQRLTTQRAIGPERIAPEWWLKNDDWQTGIRDYWKVETKQGQRLWLFYTPQKPNWFVHGEFA